MKGDMHNIHRYLMINVTSELDSISMETCPSLLDSVDVSFLIFQSVYKALRKKMKFEKIQQTILTNIGHKVT